MMQPSKDWYRCHICGKRYASDGDLSWGSSAFGDSCPVSKLYSQPIETINESAQFKLLEGSGLGTCFGSPSGL